MQGHQLEIQHIPGKVNPADHLPRQSISCANLTKNRIRDEYNKFVERMRIPADASDQQIQSIFIEVLQKDHFPRAVESVFHKFNCEDSSQTESMNDSGKLLICHSRITIENSLKPINWEAHKEDEICAEILKENT